MTSRETGRMRLPESRLRVILSIASPPSLLVLVWGAWAVDAAWPVIAILALLAVLLGYVIAFDFPVAVEFDETGVHRACLLRRHTLPWGTIAAIVQPRKRGLLLITEDRKRHSLLDRRLHDDELDLLRDEAEMRGVRVEL